jgi:ribonuclease HI
MAAGTTTVRHTLMVGSSCDDREGITGIGLVVHQATRPGRNGIVVDQLGEAYRGVPHNLVEMFAVLRALEISADRGFRIVKVRSDCNRMRRQLKDAHKLGASQQGPGLQGHILRLATRFEDVKFAYQPRKKNHGAHILARRAVREAMPATRTDLFAR